MLKIGRNVRKERHTVQGEKYDETKRSVDWRFFQDLENIQVFYFYMMHPVHGMLKTFE